MDKYEKLKYNPQFLKKAYDLVKDDFPKLFKDGDDYTEEDEKNWNIALDKIYNNFVTPEEDDFIEIWGETDGTIGLIDYVHENMNQFMESSDKYVEAFRESCRKLEEENAATRHFKNAQDHYSSDSYSNMEDVNFVQFMNELFEKIAVIHDDNAAYLANSSELKTNSQTARLYKILDQMYNLIPGMKNDGGYEAHEKSWSPKDKIKNFKN